MDKPEMDFFDTTLLPWQAVEEVPGRYQKILVKDRRNDGYTRMVWNQPDLDGCIRDFATPRNNSYIYNDSMWTEVMILEGTVLDVEKQNTYIRGYYANLAPGTKHGPYFFPLGALWIETRYPELG
jgi:hypothetical protein